ncbi:hypothetical protein [Paraburkholderia acidisoli]|uniref:Uncharacterized protein n=1 Tax=Paraburkholderia acidisoli TaxID=2571748 RepID=A0A7Z2GRA4_9BURK|nr:hypothetical protein [Paraburkholderia acidisoli]QGZ66250.1 hypothetical protein FAZ98_31095 [Paraburkholderia acidisoli]QGZ66341.1 hypothetical protein FAZ98_31605 [Paraburkholderia acidisoli]
MNGYASIAAKASGTIVVFNSTAYPVNPSYFARSLYRSFYCKAPNRTFYAAAPARNFLVRIRPMQIAIPTMSPMDPRETVVLTFDATAILNGATLTQFSTPIITAELGSDRTTLPVLSNVIINSAPVTIGNITIKAGCAVQAEASAGAFGAQYLIAIPCETSNPQFSPVLKAILPMANQ